MEAILRLTAELTGVTEIARLVSKQPSRQVVGDITDNSVMVAGSWEGEGNHLLSLYHQSSYQLALGLL